MSSPSETTRISVTSNQGVTGALFGLAIITYVTRTYIRIRILKQFFTEDILLSLAVVCLCATTGLAYTSMPYQYGALAAILHKEGLAALISLLATVQRSSRLENSASMLWFLVIFSVKLAFLFFFRRLIIRWRNLYIWWWCATAFVVFAFIVSLVADWLTCPYFTVDGVLSCTSSYRVIRDTVITTVMDILTDFIVISFPIAMLWQVNITARQKAGIGFWLCLSFVMVIIAIVRIAGIKLPGGNVDIVWLAFWEQQESSIAVIMVSMSAFRSLFVESTGTPAPRKAPNFSANNWGRRLVRRALGSGNQNGDLERSMGLPQIPRATLTGMSETIREV